MSNHMPWPVFAQYKLIILVCDFKLLFFPNIMRIYQTPAQYFPSSILVFLCNVIQDFLFACMTLQLFGYWEHPLPWTEMKDSFPGLCALNLTFCQQVLWPVLITRLNTFVPSAAISNLTTSVISYSQRHIC